MAPGSSDMEVFNENLIRNVYAFIGRQFHSDPGGRTGSAEWPPSDDDMWAIKGTVAKGRASDVAPSTLRS